MNVLKFVAKSVGIICVPIAFIDCVGSPGFVEGTSMEPTLEGDHTSWWKNDIVWLQRWFSEPTEGQIFTFISPRNPEHVYIKRLTNGPGRRVQWKDGAMYVVPENHFWMLADNPQNAIDSTYFGAVNRGLLTAKATRIIWPPERWRKL